MKGDEYTGFEMISNPTSGRRTTPQTKKRSARQLGPPCTSQVCQRRSNRHCQLFTPVDRAQLFNQFWKEFDWGQKREYVRSLVDQTPPKRSTIQGRESRKTESFQYYLKLNGIRKQVCRGMFMSTLGLRQEQLRQWITVARRTEQKKRTIQKGRDTSFAKSFLQDLPKLEIHYCRKDTKKKYLEPVFRSISELYSVYVTKCTEDSVVPIARSTFYDMIDRMKIGIHMPKKDLCDTCTSFEAGNLTKEEFDLHQQKKESARTEKETDKTNAISGNVHVIAKDVQKVLLSPMMTASALYYKTKLVVHNFTIFDLATSDVKCFIWDETQADLVGSVFATCLISYLDEFFKDDLPIIIYSDGCTSQNRNAILSNALIHYSVKTKKTVIQKYLEKGHTQMEVDSVHATIERKINSRTIYLPQDYTDLIQSARVKEKPYEVQYMSNEDFMDYSKFRAYKSIRPGHKTSDPHVTDLRQIKYNPDGTLDYKLDHRENWKQLGKKVRVDSSTTFPKLFSGRLPITKRKFEDLQDLLHVLPESHHLFYKSLPHRN